MEEIIEIAKPILTILIILISNTVTYVVKKREAEMKDVALKAVEKAENDFRGFHDKGKQKRAYAVAQICAKFPHLKESKVDKLIDFTLDAMQSYADEKTKKALDNLDKAMGGNHNEEISD